MGAQAFPKKLHVKVESQADCSFFSLQLQRLDFFPLQF